MRVLRFPGFALLLIMGVSALGAGAVAGLPKAVVVETVSGLHKVSTFRSTVGEVLSDLGVTPAQADRITPAASTRLASGMHIVHERAFPVTLIADGRQRTVMTVATTVDEFLAGHPGGVVVRARDRVYPSPYDALWAGAVVRIVRIETKITSEPERVPYAQVARPDASLPRGVTRVFQPGRPGTRLRQIATTTADGVVIERQVVAMIVINPPQDRILQIGTRRVWASRGPFAGKEIVMMEATAYAPWDGPGTNDITSIGMKAGYGVVAIDPTVIPYRSELFIEGYGRAIAGDTGGAIVGHRIDLGYNTIREALNFGRRVVKVYILSTPGQR
jgi:3D (Asp-Asp-Asp) domain-containing protein